QGCPRGRNEVLRHHHGSGRGTARGLDRRWTAAGLLPVQRSRSGPEDVLDNLAARWSTCRRANRRQRLHEGRRERDLLVRGRDRVVEEQGGTRLAQATGAGLLRLDV